MERSVFITAFDKTRLEELIAVAGEFGAHRRQDLTTLQAELARATVVDPQEVPPDVVTMNSKVLLRDLDSNDAMRYTLVFPNDADIDIGAISILAPIGTAILGYREGDTVEWTVPSGTRHLKIEKLVYQPEAAGDFTR